MIFSPKILVNYESGWMGPDLTRIFFVENCPKIALNQYRYFGLGLYPVYSVCMYIVTDTVNCISTTELPGSS